MKTFLYTVLMVASLHLVRCVTIQHRADQGPAGPDQASETYVEMFLSSIGSSLISFLGMRTGHWTREDVNTSLSEPHTSEASEVRLPQCPAESGHCRTVYGEELSCGRTFHQARIVNGSQPSAGSHPWAVQIMLRKSRAKILCAGSLLTDKFLITAAHCFNRVRPADIVLVLGNSRTDGSSSQYQQLRRIDSVFIREDFDEITYNNDIAVVKMERSVEFNNLIRPICLPAINEDYAGSSASVVGWGRLAHNGALPDTIQEAEVRILSQDTCRHSTHHLPEEITNNMLCAGDEEAGTDACQGDSGGPLILSQPQGNLLVGIVSWGIDCAKPGYPGVYTRIGTFLNWIRDIVEEGDSCFCNELSKDNREKVEAEASKDSLKLEIHRLREQLELLAQRGGQVIVELTSKLEAKDEKIDQLEGTIRNLVNSTLTT